MTKLFKFSKLIRFNSNKKRHKKNSSSFFDEKKKTFIHITNENTLSKSTILHIFYITSVQTTQNLITMRLISELNLKKTV